MPAALAPLLVLAGLIVALGIIMCGKAFTDAMLLLIGGTIGKVPLLGWAVGKPAVKGLQALSNKLGTYADGIGAEVGAMWHRLAVLTERLGWATFHLAQAVDTLLYYTTAAYPLAVLWRLAHAAYGEARHAAHAVAGYARPVTVIVKEAARPGSTVLGKAMRAAIQPLRRELTRFERDTLDRIANLQAQLAHAGSVVIDAPGVATPDLSGALARLRDRLGRLENRGTALIGLGALAAAASRIGLGHARCDNTQRWNRQVCRMDSDLLDSLLGGLLVIFGTVSLLDLARGMQDITGEVADAARAFIREASAADAGNVPAREPFGLELTPPRG